MVNREWVDATVKSYTQSKDVYGQRTVSNTSRDIEVVLRLFSNNKVDDVRYNDATHLALTADKAVSDSDTLEINGVVYKVLYIVPSPRLNTLILKVME